MPHLGNPTPYAAMMVLSFRNNPNFTGERFFETLVWSLPNLRALDVSGTGVNCDGIAPPPSSDTGSTAYGARPPHEHLEVLLLGHLRPKNPRLHALNLYTGGLHDTDMGFFVHLYPALQVLDLSEHLGLTDFGISHLSSLPLRRVRFSRNSRITATGLGNLLTAKPRPRSQENRRLLIELIRCKKVSLGGLKKMFPRARNFMGSTWLAGCPIDNHGNKDEWAPPLPGGLEAVEIKKDKPGYGNDEEELRIPEEYIFRACQDGETERKDGG